MTRSALVLAVVACAGLVALATSAQGHTKQYPTKVGKVKRELVPGVGYRYWGQITSPEPKCEKRRSVSVLVNVVEPTETDRTDSKGNWEIMATFGYRTETFVTVSGSSAQSSGEHKHTCKVGQGSTVFTDSIEPGNP